MLTFEDKIVIKVCGNVKYFLLEDLEKNFLTNSKRNRKRGTLNNFLQKLQTGLTERTAGSCRLFFMLCLFYQVMWCS